MSIEIELTKENLLIVPETEGAIQVLNEKQVIILIQETSNLRLTLEEHLNMNRKVCYFNYDEDPL